MKLDWRKPLPVGSSLFAPYGCAAMALIAALVIGSTVAELYL